MTVFGLRFFMSLPTHSEKYNQSGVLTAVRLRTHRQQVGNWPTQSPPPTIIFCYQPDLLSYAAKKYRGKKVNGFFGELYVLKKTASQIGVIGNFGVGAPVIAVLVEDLAAWGVTHFIGIGQAGGLQPDQSAGDCVLVDRAIRDEGTSYHYLPADVKAVPTGDTTARLQQALLAQKRPFTTGTTWTTDAPYRETAFEIMQFRDQGVQTVEMETAAFFAVGQYVEVETAVCLIISDQLTPDRWHPAANPKRMQDMLRSVLDTAVTL
jgi:uridine phosphorylase